jgi:hypothetical protein
VTLCIVIAVAFFLVYLRAGLDRQQTIRCVMCGSLSGEKHHRDCPWGKR